MSFLLRCAFCVAASLCVLGCARSSERDGPVDAGVPQDAFRLRRDGAELVPRDAGPRMRDAYIEPRCPDAGPFAREVPPPECDPLDPSSCGDALACYPVILYPMGTCGGEAYTAICYPAGTGEQETRCMDARDCAPGHTCFITGATNRCLKLCDPHRVPADCPRGRVCSGTDNPLYGACL